MQLDRVLGFGRRDVGFVELDGRGIERRFGVAALALQPLVRAEGGVDRFGFVVGFELHVDVGLFGLVADLHGIGGGFGGFESFGDGERHVLAVVADDIVFERRAAFFHVAFEAFCREWSGRSGRYSADDKIARTPGIFSAAETSSDVMRPLAIVAPTGTA